MGELASKTNQETRVEASLVGGRQLWHGGSFEAIYRPPVARHEECQQAETARQFTCLFKKRGSEGLEDGPVVKNIS